MKVVLDSDYQLLSVQIESKLDRGGAVVVFLDLRRAFDTVNHNVMLSKFQLPVLKIHKIY